MQKYKKTRKNQMEEMGKTKRKSRLRRREKKKKETWGAKGTQRKMEPMDFVGRVSQAKASHFLSGGEAGLGNQ